MKFAVGETWKTRRGHIIEIKQTDFPDKTYPVFGIRVGVKHRVGGLTFTPEGIHVAGSQTDNDLMHKVNYEPKPKAEKKATVAKEQAKHPLQQIIDNGRAAKPTHLGGYGANMVYITPEMYDALAVALNPVTMDAREAFEAWAVKQPKHVIKDIQRYSQDWSDKHLQGKYGHCDTQTAWETWNQAWTNGVNMINGSVARMKLERDVFRALAEGMEFRNLDEMVERENAVSFARAVGSEAKRVAKELKTTIENMLWIREGMQARKGTPE